MGVDDVVIGAPIAAGETLYAASKVLDVRDHDDRTAIVRFRVCAVRGTPTSVLLERGVDLFAERIAETAVLLTRTVLMRRSPGRTTLGA